MVGNVLGEPLLGRYVLKSLTLIEHEILGVSVNDAELEEAFALAEADPKVKAGYLTVEAMPWIAVPNHSDFPNASSSSSARR